ncbi:MAG: hypothetical protein HY985_10740 [Magnetospirillum sp.]|nr:hypothetical protein [Magnetospirillum sp.]
MEVIHVPMTRFRRELKKMLRLIEQGQVIIVTRRGIPTLIAQPIDLANDDENWRYDFLDGLSRWLRCPLAMAIAPIQGQTY